ncbi:MAG: leucine--tRNA ligase [Gemmatimonadota bacterium]|uniref:leucine--tRNA ligase n=1 Tax=Candidatus Palauibacter scopulicola TaxID=3056741 RepID=UPI00239BD2F8|nr:leucine--tRNA ligase [Candidatus Palauibacter scopulicola]MDE2662638.1 leucine--tRNA ligase [Candidatus Palauibacter scopulicola]
MYDPIAIESRWQAWWEENGTNEPDLDGAERPFFNLMMYPYPSAEGLHVGNLYAFTGADIYGRFRRLRGDDVFEPIGYDAFGIHSENHALKVDTHPMELIPSNIRNFERMLRAAGLMTDWSRTVDTTDPRYYKWTQWIFVQLFRAGLAEKKEAAVNWCPQCQTVLANEQVIAGLCERCDAAVEQRMLSQWFFRITEYAQRLLDNLDWIDWSETTKTAQRNWIGRSDGARLHFPLSGATASSGAAAGSGDAGAGQADRIEVFTTRPDTLFGATFMVLAPEHPLVERLTTDERRAEVEAYVRAAAAVDLVERQKTDDRDKTGVFTGGYARNPATGEDIPVWVADYVLMDYGTGAIMAVPGHDQRDFDFARQFGLSIVQVVCSRAALPEGADPADIGGGEAEAAFVEHTADEMLVNSGRFSGMEADAGGRAITEWLAERGLAAAEVNYRLHDWCISRQRYWGPPIPIIYCDSCGPQAVPEEDLPVVLPYVEDFRPTATGVSPLARDPEFYTAVCPACGADARRETDVSDTFLDSGWYFLRYPSTEFDDRPFDPERTQAWLPVSSYIGGEEHSVLHLLYSRFLTMVLHDLGHLEFEEPYDRFRKHGLLIRDGAKISKSRGNVILPDQYIQRYGADTFRMYLMFLGPFQRGGDFRDSGLAGPDRFLKKVWDSVTAAAEAERTGFDDPGVERALHATIRQISEDLEALSYNTAIAAAMDYLNTLRAGGRTASIDEVRPLVILIAPVAPHIAEELWARLGGASSLFDHAEWPAWDERKLMVDEVELPVQVNGRLRATIRVARGAPEDVVREAALAEANVIRRLDGVAIRKVIHVPDRMLNLVVS